jgi:glycosyltransferase involved in cell wall biosynthesis
VPPSDREALAEALLALFQEPEHTAQMAELARRRVLERHQAERLVADVDRLYQELLAAMGTSLPAGLTGTEGVADA